MGGGDTAEMQNSELTYRGRLGRLNYFDVRDFSKRVERPNEPLEIGRLDSVSFGHRALTPLASALPLSASPPIKFCLVFSRIRS